MAAYECARYTNETGFLGTVQVPITKAVPTGQTIVMVVGGFAVNAVTSFSATDDKGNTWVQRTLSIQSSPVNGQMALLTCVVSTPLAVGDNISVKANNRSPDKWAVVGVAFSDITGIDVTASTIGTGADLVTGTAESPTQSYQVLVGGFSWTGTPTWTPQNTVEGFVSATASPSATARSVGLAWRTDSSIEPRFLAATLSSPQDWTGGLVALNAIEIPPLDTPTGFSFEADATQPRIYASWNAVEGAAKYEVEVETFDSSWEPLTSKVVSTSTVTFTTSDGIDSGGNYRARVRALPPGAA